MKNNKIWITIGILSVSLWGCQGTNHEHEEVADPGMEAFERNAITVSNYLADWQNENVDYDKYYAEDYEAWGTAFGDLDTMRLADVKEWDQYIFEAYDFKIAADEVVMLPGVNPENKKIDGSVRYYTEWAITKVATDSTEARTGNISMYQAYVFNDEGKIIMDLTYGDFGGLMKYLNGTD